MLDLILLISKGQLAQDSSSLEDYPKILGQ